MSHAGALGKAGWGAAMETNGKDSLCIRANRSVRQCRLCFVEGFQHWLVLISEATISQFEKAIWAAF